MTCEVIAVGLGETHPARRLLRTNPMNQFRIVLIAMFTVVVLYTGVTIAKQGPDLAPVFFGDLAKFAWPGQFDLDFTGLLALSAIWVAWRNQFSVAGLGLAVLAFFGGTGFLSAYLLVVSLQAKGNMNEILLGQIRAAVVPPRS